MAKFQPGKSGNPGGRPKKDNLLVKLAKAKTPEAFKRIAELMQSTDEAVSLGATKVVFEYGFGKPRQELDISGEDLRSLTAAIIIESKSK